MTRIGLVGCVKSKRGYATAAADLYTSPLFTGRRASVEQTCDRWYILSALHGLMEPDEVVDPYDETLVGASTSRKRAWASHVLDQIDDVIGEVDAVTFEVHAGNDYCDHGLLAGLRRRGARVERPTQGLAMGEQLAFYSGTRPARPASDEDRPRVRPPVTRASTVPVEAEGSYPPRGRYAPLYELLDTSSSDQHELSFSDVEEVLGGDLPASARNHRAWWANDASHSHARAWLAAGFRTTGVNLTAERVTFIRG